MKYIVFDMEWNQTMGPCRTLADGHTLTGEIIEIGAVRLSEDFKIEDTFKVIVKPVFYKKMHKKVQALTGLTSDVVNAGVPFQQAYKMFLDFCTDDFATVTWGESDVPILRENIFAHKLGSWKAANYNVQRIYDSEISHSQNDTGLDTAAEAMGIYATEPYHDALNDAMATAAICTKIDMAGAISRYQAPPLSLSSRDHLTYECVYGITNVPAMKNHPRVKYTLCPVCKRPLSASRLIPHRSGKKIAKITCPDHGDFLLMVRVTKGKGDTHVASKYVYGWDGEIEKLYEDKLKVADRKKDAFLSKIRKGKENK